MLHRELQHQDRYLSLPGSGPGNAVFFHEHFNGLQNQCINNTGTDVTLTNVGVAIANMGGSYADNVAIVQKGFWFNWIKGVLAGGNTLPEDNSGAGAYDMTLRDVTVNAGNPGLIGSQNLTGIPFIADVRQNFASLCGGIEDIQAECGHGERHREFPPARRTPQETPALLLCLPDSTRHRLQEHPLCGRCGEYSCNAGLYGLRVESESRFRTLRRQTVEVG